LFYALNAYLYASSALNLIFLSIYTSILFLFWSYELRGSYLFVSEPLRSSPRGSTSIEPAPGSPHGGTS